jgi:hypothetical protein
VRTEARGSGPGLGGWTPAEPRAQRLIKVACSTLTRSRDEADGAVA